MIEKRQNKEGGSIEHRVCQFQLGKPKQLQYQQSKGFLRLSLGFLSNLGKLLLLLLISFFTRSGAASPSLGGRSSGHLPRSSGCAPSFIAGRRLAAARTARLRRAGFTCGFFVGHNSSISSSVNVERWNR